MESNFSKKQLASIAVLAVLTVFIALTFMHYPPGFLSRYLRGFTTSPIAVGMNAPKFELPSLDGDVIALDEYRGKPVLVKFWSVY